MTLETSVVSPEAKRLGISERLRAVQLTPRRALLLVLLGLAVEIAIMYGRSINNGFVGDDWQLLNFSNHGVPYVLSWHAQDASAYHYDPISEFFLLVLFQVFGLRPLVFHGAAYLLFWLDAVLILLLGRRITGNLSVGALAAALFIAFGNQYEAVIWGLVSILQTMGLAAFLGGLLLYLRAHDARLDQRRRKQSYIGFLAALVLAPFIYEQTVALIAVCALYRFLVIEDKAGFSAQALLVRAKAWLRDFTVPTILVVCYLGLKWWMGKNSTVPMVPGLTHTYTSRPLELTAATGFLRSLLPGVGAQAASTLLAGWSVHYHRITAVVVMVFALSMLLARALYRFLLAWIGVLVVSITLGLGAIASRHLNLILAPSAIMWAGFLVYLVARVRSWLERTALPDAWSAGLAFAPAVALALAFAITGFGFAAVQQDAWAAAGDTVQQAVTRVGGYARANPTATTLYVVDLPDSSASSTGDPTYFFRNAAPLVVPLAYPGRFKQVVAVRTHDYGYAKDYSVLASEAQIAQWSRQPGALVLWYDDATGQLRQWTPPPSA
jgi:hypothetical protein